MVKARTWFTLFMVSVGTIAATASCGSDEATGGSSGGGSIISGGGSSGSTGRAGATGRAGSSGSGSADATMLGVECTADADCGDGMVCATANGTLFGDGGPSNGMCTMACDVGGTACDSLKAGAECFNFGTTAAPAGYCLDSCTIGQVADVNTKCAGRADFVCIDLGDATTSLPFCVPHCLADADCGTGLYCDKSGPLGLCTKTKPSGDPIGTACNPGTADTPAAKTCEAYCLRTSDDGVTPPTGVCAELCSAGSPCMFGSGSKPSPGGFCGGAFSDSPGAIDLGYCLANCDCTSDCKFDGDLCRKWAASESDLETLTGSPGVCFPVASMSVELTCGEGGAGGDGAGGAGGDGPGTPPSSAAGASGSGN